MTCFFVLSSPHQGCLCCQWWQGVGVGAGCRSCTAQKGGLVGRWSDTMKRCLCWFQISNCKMLIQINSNEAMNVHDCLNYLCFSTFKGCIYWIRYRADDRHTQARFLLKYILKQGPSTIFLWKSQGNQGGVIPDNLGRHWSHVEAYRKLALQYHPDKQRNEKDKVGALEAGPWADWSAILLWEFCLAVTRCRCTYHEVFVHVTCLYAVIMVQASATEKFRKVVEAYEAHRKRRQIMLKGG